MQHKIEGSTLTLERVFSAPRQKVWDVFTKPELFSKWWGPKGWSTEVKEFNFTEGGINHYGMKCDDSEQTDWYGKYSWGKMVYEKINPIESIVYKDYFVDENAEVQVGMPVSESDLRFVEANEGTKLVCVVTYESEEALKTVVEMGMLQGIAMTWDNLEALLMKN